MHRWKEEVGWSIVAHFHRRLWALTHNYVVDTVDTNITQLHVSTIILLFNMKVRVMIYLDI